MVSGVLWLMNFLRLIVLWCSWLLNGVLRVVCLRLSFVLVSVVLVVMMWVCVLVSCGLCSVSEFVLLVLSLVYFLCVIWFLVFLWVSLIFV